MSEKRMNLVPCVHIFVRGDELYCPKCWKPALHGDVEYHYAGIRLSYIGYQGAYLDSTVDVDIDDADHIESNLVGIHCDACNWRIDPRKDDVLIIVEGEDA